jgi:cobyrinic acid a,c-diamide synthase
MIACCARPATRESEVRARTLVGWREVLVEGLRTREIDHVASAAPFVLARLGPGSRAALRKEGIAVRRADTFPGLDGSWARIAVRPPDTTAQFFAALDRVRAPETAL